MSSLKEIIKMTQQISPSLKWSLSTIDNVRPLGFSWKGWERSRRAQECTEIWKKEETFFIENLCQPVQVLREANAKTNSSARKVCEAKERRKRKQEWAGRTSHGHAGLTPASQREEGEGLWRGGGGWGGRGGKEGERTWGCEHQTTLQLREGVSQSSTEPRAEAAGWSPPTWGGPFSSPSSSTLHHAESLPGSLPRCGFRKAPVDSQGSTAGSEVKGELSSTGQGCPGLRLYGQLFV